MSHTTKTPWRTVMATAIVSVLAGCTTLADVRTMQGDSNQLVHERMRAANTPVRTSSSFVVENGFHAARAPLETSPLNPRTRLPDAFSKDASMDIQSSTSLPEITQRITRMSGYQVTIDSDVAGTAGGPSFSELAFKGNLEGLLDYVAGQADISWRWDGGRVHLFRYETKMFRVSALAGTTQVSTKLDTTASSTGSSEGSASSGDSGQTTTIESSFDLWTDIEASIKSLMSSSGTINISSSAAMITVRDTPRVLAQVEAQVRELNRIYSRQVQLQVEVYSVERSASDSVGVDWNIAWQEAAGRYGLEFGSSGLGTDSSSPSPGFGANVSQGPFAGSGVMFQALSSLGKTSLLTSGTVSSLNGQAVPLNVSREQAYLQSYSTTLASGVGTQATTTLTPGVVTEGFSMNFIPRIMEDNQVMLRYSIDLSSTDAIDTFEAPDGNSAIQLPRRSVRNFMQNVNVRSGQTLVLTGFQQASGTSDGSGPFSPSAWILGGKKTATAGTRTIVIVVTPYVVE